MKITHSMIYFYEQAIKRINEIFPEATMDCIPDYYEIGYWNDEESFINKHGAWEYPGCWYPSPVRVSEDEMVNILVEEGLKNIRNKD